MIVKIVIEACKLDFEVISSANRAFGLLARFERATYVSEGITSDYPKSLIGRKRTLSAKTKATP